MAEPNRSPGRGRRGAPAAGGGEQRVEQGGFPAALRADDASGRATPRRVVCRWRQAWLTALPSSGRAATPRASRAPQTGQPVLTTFVAAAALAPPGRARARAWAAA